MKSITTTLLGLAIVALAAGRAQATEPEITTVERPTLSIDTVSTAPAFTPLPFIDRILEPGSTMMAIGIYAGVNYAMHSGGFTVSQNGVTCCTFQDGTGIGIIAGVKAFVPIIEGIDVTPRIAYEARPGTFTALTEPLPFLGQSNEIELIRFEDEFVASMSAITIDPMISYTFGENLPYVVAGPSFGILAGRGFVKNESIPAPDGVFYLDGSLSRRITSGDLESTRSLSVGIRGGAGIRIPLSETLSINPEALYTFPVTTVTSLDDWKTSTLQGTVGILYTF